jgi:predicted dehydrogenase
LGLLGCGPAAERSYVPAIARLTNARLTAAYDEAADRSRRLARSAPGCRAFDSAEALLNARVVDAVLIASPLESRASLAVKALGAGLPVLIEPPLAASLEEAEWIRDAERAVRLPVMLGFNRRWWGPIERLRRVLAGGQEGEVAVDGAIVTDLRDADSFVALAAHLDLVRHLVDREVATISGRRDVPEEIQAQVRFHGGGAALCGARPGHRPEERITIRSGLRTYEIRSGSERFWPATGAGRRALDLVDCASRRVVGSRDSFERSVEAQLAAFVETVQSRAGRSPGTTDGTASLLIIDALRHSLEAGGIEIAVPATPSR